MSGFAGLVSIVGLVSSPFPVMRDPRDGGSVYTIAPADDPGKARNVHRSLLKDHPGPADAAETRVACPPEDVEPSLISLYLHFIHEGRRDVYYYYVEV